jgi:N-acetylglucosaminyldiphosphoundecaprenol N-acetyl-beta-D-mannosaminyltransferase
MNYQIPNKILLLGVPVDRIERGDLETHIERLIEASVNDKQTKFATTITALFLGKLSSFVLNDRLMPQVVSTLRQADFIGIDSKELQLLAKVLGNNVESLVRPEDLLLASSSLLKRYNQSIFLLGWNEELTKTTAESLKIDFPGLKIAGIAAPEIYTKGPEINESIQADDVIIEMINEARPTVLALSLGHPKLEIWLERVKGRIQVPLIIGVGGSFERYLAQREGKTSSPFRKFSWTKWMQKIQSFLHYCFWIPPLIAFNTFNHLVYEFILKRFQKEPVVRPYLFLSKKETIYIAPFPPFVNRASWESQLKSMDEAFEHDNIVLDFEYVRHINPSGMGLLHAIWKRMQEKNKNLFFIGINGDIRCLLKLNGAWDMIAASVKEGADEVLESLSINKEENLLNTRIFLSIDQLKDQTILSFFGRLHTYDVETASGFSLEPLLNGRNLTINLEHCSSINNLGFGFLLTLRDHQKRQGQSLVIENASRFVKNQFKYYQLDSYFKFV